MMKQAKKFIAIMLTFVFVLSLVPLGALAEVEPSLKTEKIYFSNYSFTRKSGNSYMHDPGIYNTNTKKTKHAIAFGGQYYGYVQLDLSGYEEILANENTSIKVSVNCGPYMDATRKCGNFNAYLVNDTADASYVARVTTQKQADNLGMHDTNRPVLFSKSDGTVTTGTQLEFDANLENLVTSLNEGADNSLVTLYLLPSGASGDPGYLETSYIAPNLSYLEISYDENEIDNQDYVDSITKDITWEDLSDEDASNVTKLPIFYKGANITWEASVPGIVAQDGTITPPLGVPANVTLTATFSYKGAYADAQTATATETFDVTIAPEQMVTTDAIMFTNYGVARSDKEACQKYGVNTDRDCHYTYFGGIYAAYAQFDLSDYEEILRTPSSQVSFKVMGGNGYTKATSPYLYDFKVFLAPDSADGYRYDDINYADAKKLGMLNKELPVLCERIDSAGVRTTVTLEANKANLLQCLDQSAGNGLVTIAYGVGESEKQCSVRPDYADTGLFISYYESELDSESYFESIKSSFTWENITKDDANVLVNNLPTYFKGASVTWTSANGTVDSDGTLNPTAKEFVDDTITATVSYKGMSFTSEEFEVTVCDGNVTLGEPTLKVENGTATASISVINGTGEDVTYYLYLAVYTDGEMTGIEPVTLKVNKGTEGSANPSCTVPDGSKVKFLVWEADGITPAIPSIEK